MLQYVSFKIKFQSSCQGAFDSSALDKHRGVRLVPATQVTGAELFQPSHPT